MRFISIELENIFGYEKPVVVPFAEPSEQRNVTLIWGRNGMGKTGFLSAVKLLFTGIENPEDRSVGFPAKRLAPRQFILGDRDGWSGVINRRAARIAAENGRPVISRVKAIWTSGDDTITAERQWTAEGGNFEESLVVYDGHSRLTQSAAEDRLQEFLPRDFVSFFFFDGEEIKRLAESAERKAIDFDRVLGTTFVTDVAQELGQAVAERRRSGLTTGKLAELQAAETALVKAKSAQAAATASIAEAEDQIASDQLELRRLTAIRENLRSGASEEQRASLEQRLSDARTGRKTALDQVAEKLPLGVPLVANLGLVDAALLSTRARIEAGGGAEAAVIRNVQNALSQWIADSPLKLTAQQIDLLVNDLKARLQTVVADRRGAGVLAEIDVHRAERLRAILENWAAAGPDRLERRVAELESAHRLHREIDMLTESLMQIEVGSQANLEAYRNAVDQILVIEARMANLNQDLGQSIKIRNDARAAEIALVDQIAKLSDQQSDAARRQADERYYNAVIRTFNELREDLRRSLRGEIEKRINERYDQIVLDHPLVSSITLDDSYTMYFHDAAGFPIGRASLSSGLKQLAATALLWAMKDVAGRDVPVIIDTPLGRIDRANQNNLLEFYYPRLGSQVIMLPTDAEIDESKLRMLEPHVREHFRIDNGETGESATIVPGQLVRVGNG